MASVERPTFTSAIPPTATITEESGVRYACWTDSRGKPVRAPIAPDGKRCRRTVPGKWYGTYTDHKGKRCKTRTFTNRATALEAALQLEKHGREVKEGRAKPGLREDSAHLVAHLSEYREHMLSRQMSARHIESAIGNIRWVLESAGITTAASVIPDRLDNWLDRERRTGRGRGSPRGGDARPLSTRTRNQWVAQLKAFGAWLARTDRAMANPFTRLTLGNTERDPRIVRRMLTESEFYRLLESTAQGGTYRGMSGRDRALLYLLAASTGFRRRALIALTPESFALGQTATVHAPGNTQKGGRGHTVPLSTETGGLIANWLAGKPAGEPVFRGTPRWHQDTAEMIRVDLAAAGIPYHDAAHRVFDFHALRGQFGAMLAIAGVPLVVAQKLLDHSTPVLTANLYSRVGSKEFAEAVEKLPSLGCALGCALGKTRQKGRKLPDTRKGRQMPKTRKTPGKSGV
jgi:integrase